ncbi:MAG: hypothetical protein SGILL_001996 [Bacillariaceae sp.]
MMKFVKALLLLSLAVGACARVPRGGTTKAAKATPAEEYKSAAAVSGPFFFKKEDNLEKLALDTTTVLKTLRPYRNDPNMEKSFNDDKRPTFAVTWNHAMWEKHTSRTRFIWQIVFWYKSALLRRIMPQWTALMLWTYGILYAADNLNLSFNINFPMVGLSLVSGFVASLLGLRTNQGLSRLLEGRQAFGKVVLYTRDMASIVSNFVYDKDHQLALLLARHLSIFSWTLKQFLRGTDTNGSDEDIIRTMLPNDADVEYIMTQRKRPVAILMRLRQALAHLSHKHMLTTAEEMAFDHAISAMDQSIMLTERIIASPIPPLFTSHAGRLIMFYLGFLPIALKSGGSMSNVAILLTMAAVGYAMLGLDELSHIMEQPFKKSPLYHLCKNSMRDVVDAFVLRPPALDGGHRSKGLKPPQPYWDEMDEFEPFSPEMKGST